MTRKNDTLWEQGANCVTLLALAFINTPLIPRSIKRTLTPVILLVFALLLIFDLWKQCEYNAEELERERRDEHSRMIHEQAVWYCHLVEDWGLLVLFAVFSLIVQNDVVAYTLMWVLAVRSLLSFAIRWWLNRKY